MCSKAGQPGSSSANTGTCQSVTSVSPERNINLKVVFLDAFHRFLTARGSSSYLVSLGSLASQSLLWCRALRPVPGLPEAPGAL